MGELNMDWQQLTSLVIVAATAVLLVRHAWHQRRMAKTHPCGGECGCSQSLIREKMKGI